LRIPGKIFRTVFPNDKQQILNDKFSIQTQRVGCGFAALRLRAFAFISGCRGKESKRPSNPGPAISHQVAPSRSESK
jgi:hypothetical protein